MMMGVLVDCIRVGVFDEKPLFLAGVIHALKVAAEMSVVAEGCSASEALRLSRDLLPNVVVLDSGLLSAMPSLARSIAEIPGSKLLVLSISVDVEQASTAFAAGARGYVLKGVSGHDFREAVRALHRGEGYVSPAVAAEMLRCQAEGGGKSPNPSLVARLSHREEQILTLLSSGLRNQEIAERLNMAEKTVKHYVTRIFAILNVRNRVEAALISTRGSPTDHSANRKHNWRGKPGIVFPARPGIEYLQINPNAFLSACQSGESTTSQCYSAIFGRDWFVAQCAMEDSREHAVGTHVFL